MNRIFCAIVVVALISAPLHAGDVLQMSDWKGLNQNNSEYAFVAPGEATFRYPDGPRGFYKHGFRMENDGTADWTRYYGIRFDVRVPEKTTELHLDVCIHASISHGPERIVPAKMSLAGAGWHTVTLPWSAFEYESAGFAFLRFVKAMSISAGDAVPQQIALRNAHLIKAPTVALECDVRGKPGRSGGDVTYAVAVTNCTNAPQSVNLGFEKRGWEVMTASVEPAPFALAPGESKPVTVTVHVSDRVPAGGHETQVLRAIANGDATAAQTLSFITVCELPHPYIMHTPVRWQEVRDKVKNYPWAKDQQDAFAQQAEQWQAPEVAKPPKNDPDDTMGPFLFATQNENSLLACAYSWQLTGNKSYAQKVATFLRRLSNPDDGYPKTLRGCNQGSVQEGHFFQHIAMCYDMIQDSGVLSEKDREQIDATLRIFIESIERLTEGGSINNWNLSQDCGAFYSALAMQDLVLADRFFSGPSGITDQLSKGTMDDGWWYECSISYNMWCASEFTQAAMAYEPFGFNFRNAWIPASYSSSVMLIAQLSGGNGVESPDPKMKGKPFGMDPSIYGPNRRPFRTITDLWNSLLPFIDYRGIMFGVNDSTEAKVAGNRTEVGGQPFEIAYFAYRDPAYAAIIKIGGGKRDLLYGVPELPDKTPERFRDNAFADNVGLTMLRSQAENRPIREQIQAVLHYGTHGWAHGHFDRTDLLSLMRYGRSFWNPESVFYVYEPFMYKFYTQTSVNHNMVVVDQKMQEATPGKRLLFHSGKLMQATAVEATARWSNPPYGGMVYDYVPVKTFEEKTWREGRYVPIPTTQPAYGTLTDFSEPILQRRLMIVTDDYVVLADYLKGDKPHTFDNLLSLKGFMSLDGPGKKMLRHDPQWNSDPLGSAQFVTNCDWYSVAAPSVARFEERWGPGVDVEGSRSNGNEDGVLKLDVRTVWPASQQIMVATAPEQHNVEKRLFYTVRGDGKTLAEGKFGAWILGQADIDLPVEGIKQLELQTSVELSKKPTVFWADARVVTRDGKEIRLGELPVKYGNVLTPPQAGKDYLGGPIRIAGIEYQSAVGGQPQDEKKPGTVQIDLSGVGAVRFKATLGSDYPLGDESQGRKTYAVRSQGNDATFLTLIEPYEEKPVVKSATAAGPDRLRVELLDGRVQDIVISNLAEDGSDLKAEVNETRDGKIVRSESSK